MIDGQVFCAPMAGISSPPYRILARRFGAAVVYSEMISSNGLVYNPMKNMKLARFTKDGRPVGIQLFGADPEIMHKAARLVSDLEPDIIDLNFGCPVQKVVKKNGGAAVLKDPGLTRALIQAAVAGSRQPVTIKIRSGWDDNTKNYLEAGRIGQEAGAAAVTLHARTRSLQFSGRAEWSHIKNLKESLDIPVIGNGDVFSGPDAARMLEETGCDAMMIGRAAMGNPWIFREINHYLETGRECPQPSLVERCELILEHARLMQQAMDPRQAMLKMRGISIRYIKGWPGAADLRRRLTKINLFDDLKNILTGYLQVHGPTGSIRTEA